MDYYLSPRTTHHRSTVIRKLKTLPGTVLLSGSIQSIIYFKPQKSVAPQILQFFYQSQLILSLS